MSLIRAIRVAAILVSLVSGCIPTTTASLEIGSGYAVNDMADAEAIVENLQFSRIWFDAPSNLRVPRVEREGRLIAAFEQRQFGVSVELQPSDGLLRLTFAERNTEFSEKGQQVLHRLTEQLRIRFGPQVRLTSSA